MFSPATVRCIKSIVGFENKTLLTILFFCLLYYLFIYLFSKTNYWPRRRNTKISAKNWTKHSTNYLVIRQSTSSSSINQNTNRTSFVLHNHFYSSSKLNVFIQQPNWIIQKEPKTKIKKTSFIFRSLFSTYLLFSSPNL